MRIGFDLRPFLREETGIGVSFRHLLSALAAIDAENEYFLLSASWKDRFPESRIPPFQRMRFRDLKVPSRALTFSWSCLGRPTLDRLFKTGLNLTHSPVPLILPTRGKRIITVHDLFFLDEPGLTDRETRRTFVRRAGKAILAADGIITVSRFSRQTVLDRFPVVERRVKAIPHGLDTSFLAAPPAEDLDRVRAGLKLPGTFLLFVGALEPRKNLVRLIEALKLLGDRGLDPVLVVAGKSGPDSARVAETVARLGLGSRVMFPGYVDELTKRCLYRLATGFVFPSLVEGFGLPILEAMASGLPVAASGTSALPEVAAEAALYFDPKSPEDMADKIRSLLENRDLRRELIDKGRHRASLFDWSRAARETLDFYHEI